MSDLKPFNLREAILQSINSQGGLPVLIANVSAAYSECIKEEIPVVLGTSDTPPDENIVLETVDHVFNLPVVLTAAFMEAAGQTILSSPGMPDAKTRCLRARLHLEETLELINKGLGVKVKVDVSKLDEHGCLTEESLQLVDNPTEFNLKEVEDGLVDIKVISIGTYLSHGMAPSPFVEQEVLVNNLTKFRTDKDGHRNEAGKWVKPSDHPEPRILIARAATQNVLDSWAEHQQLKSLLEITESASPSND
jgi:hypothetical protein